MKVHEIRKTFLDFFASKDHKVVKSSPLLPQDDPTILFTNAGMNQFKNVFLGLDKRSYTRAASVQKCMRVSGKHNDLEQVGKTSKHHTFFEMLGNFSFGDYFKKEAIEYAWELITQVYRMEESRLFVTVYEEDEEAYEIWNKGVGLSPDRVFRMGKEHNYWSMGETGPCGPCSEIHYDMGTEFGEGETEALIATGSDRFVELWNLVFMQFNQEGDGKIRPLPSPSVDTGMGLERMAAVLQNKSNNYETDLFMPIIDNLGSMCDRELPSHDETDIPVRIIADHIRAISFLIGDGIMPANEGRGYVLRRLIRRAFRAGDALGFKDPFLYKLVGAVIDIMKDAYPELLSSSDYIAKVCLSEERRFAMTLSSGLRVFQQYISETKKKKQGVIPGEKVFKLYDTFGFPLDLSRELAEEEQMEVDEKGFHQELENQKQRARLSWKGEDRQKELKAYEKFKDLDTRFKGNEQDKIAETEVLALMKNRSEVRQLNEGESGEVFLSETPFYAEAGGQIGDKGILKNPHFSAVVETTYFPIPDIISHRITVLSGSVMLGDLMEADVDISTRQAIRKNHTATHLLHASLRQIIGDHVKQAGSLVSPSRLRFDFTHYASLSISELEGVESLVNEKIQECIPVHTQISSLEEGIEEGAIAIFEEKYKEEVRIVSIEGFSKELCGGIHAHNTGEIGLFKIVSESSVATGMRRIEALTGEAALIHIQENDAILGEMQQILNASRKGLIDQLEKLKKTLKENEKDTKSLRQRIANMSFQKKEDEVRKLKGIPVLVKRVDGLDNTELRELADSLKQKLGSGIVLLGAVSGPKAFIISVVTKDLAARIKAKEIIQQVAPLIGGGGGGRSDFAQAGGKKTDQLDLALEKSFEIIEEMIP